MIRYLLIIITMVELFSCSQSTSIKYENYATSMDEYNALVKFYEMTNGPHWKKNTGWLQSTNFCNWYGVHCCRNNNSNNNNNNENNNKQTPAVCQINLRSNNLQGILPSLRNLTELYNLYLFNNFITGVENGFSGFRRLTYLNLNANNISHLPADFLLDSDQLLTIEMSENQLISIPQATVWNKTKVVLINFSRNRLQTIPSFNFPNSIMSLDLAYNNISTLLPLNTPSLSSLFLLYNSIEKIDENFGASFENLRTIHLAHNKLTMLPDNFGLWIESATDIYLSNNRLRELPLSLGKIKSRLWIVDLSNNQLKSLPPNIESLKAERLDLSNNQLTNLPTLNVEYLNVRNNLIEKLTYTILRGPTFLDLSENLISSFEQAEEFNIFNNLNILDLSWNNITKTPRWGEQYFGHLSFLDMSYNQLEELKWNFMSAPVLQYASFTHNDLKEFYPTSIFSFPRLKLLDLTSNPNLKFNFDVKGKSIENENDSDPWLEECFDVDTLSVSTFHFSSSVLYCKRYISNDQCYGLFGTGASFLFDPSALNYTHCYPMNRMN